MNPKPGNLIQIKRGVHGMGEVGMVIGPAEADDRLGVSGGCLNVLFYDGPRRVHPSNMQKPDGRTRPRADDQACYYNSPSRDRRG
jgi:hypothetical protein